MSGGGVTWLATAAPPFYEVSGYTGGYSTSVPLEVPSFRGLEPSLALVYGSSGRRRIRGSGMESQRASTRSSAGMPKAAGRAGMRPIRTGSEGKSSCRAGRARVPGCQSGGTHFAENENYLRIVAERERHLGR